MKVNIAGVLALLVAISLSIGPVSAIDVDDSMSNAEIQGYIDGAGVGETINFLEGTYLNISLIINKTLNLVSNGATLIGNGTNHILTISNTIGVTITGFTIDINGTGGDGIRGSNVTSAVIANNTIKNGGDGISIFMMYKNLTIANNTITNMTENFGDAISLVNHNTNQETDTSTTIEGNIIDSSIYGIFLGGNFKGNITNNNITNTQVGLQTTGRQNATSGSLIADIKNNIMPGIQMENPNVIYLNLSNNNLGQLNNTGYSIQTNAFFNKTGTIHVHNNYIGYTVSTPFQCATDTATGNTGPGAYNFP